MCRILQHPRTQSTLREDGVRNYEIIKKETTFAAVPWEYNVRSTFVFIGQSEGIYLYYINTIYLYLREKQKKPYG